MSKTFVYYIYYFNVSIEIFSLNVIEKKYIQFECQFNNKKKSLGFN